MASIVIHEAPAEVVQQAQHILESHHEHLLEARILFLFSNAKATSRGKVLPGKGKKLTPEQRFLSSYRDSEDDAEVSVEEGYDFIVTIYEHQWHGLLKTQRAALLDHLLCWCDRKERSNRRTGAVTYSWAMRGPDVEEFSEIVERHGLWQPSIRKFVQRADLSKQLELPPDQVVDVKVPVERTTTVDGDGTVVETRVGVHDAIEAVAALAGGLEPVAAEDYASPNGVKSDSVELPHGHEVTAMLMEHSGDPRPREEILADLDARDAALDAAKLPPDEADVASQVSQDVEDASGLNAQEADSGAVSATNGSVGAPVRAGADWRERAGIGRTARPRHP